MNWLEIISAIGGVVVALAALGVSSVLTYYIYFVNRRIADVEHWRANRDAWIQIDSLVRSNDHLLQAADSLWHPELAQETPTEERRKRWLAYMALNTYVAAYFDPSRRPWPSLEESRKDIRTALKPLIRDDVFYHATQSGLYPSEFEEACRKLRQEQESTRSR
jgi:hypothetical protein